METLTISHFPYYTFEDQAMAYTVGSAFYGLYFIVSFPVRPSPNPQPQALTLPALLALPRLGAPLDHSQPSTLTTNPSQPSTLTT